MPISVTCSGCGKSLKVKDEWAGKQGKCPQCKATFAIPAAGAAPASAGKRTAPKAGAAPKQKGSGGISISWGPVIGVVFVVGVVALIGAYYFGPVKVKAEWEKIGSDANNTVESVITLAIQAYLSENGGFDPGKAHHTPQASDDILFIFNPFVMSMPESVPFKGSSTEGPFEGKFHPKTGEVEADVDIGGTSIAGLGAVRKGDTKIKVTGRLVNQHAVAEVNGKKAEIKYRPKDEDN